jgi:uncharacterized protein (DUF952 family)
MMKHEKIYHITSRAAWQAAREAGVYSADSLEAEGFIHASTQEQVVRTANRFYHGQQGLVLLEIQAAKVGVEIKYEDLAGEGMLFPHIFGALQVNAVSGWAAFEPSDDGSFCFPLQFESMI